MIKNNKKQKKKKKKKEKKRKRKKKKKERKKEKISKKEENLGAKNSELRKIWGIPDFGRFLKIPIVRAEFETFRERSNVFPLEP